MTSNPLEVFAEHVAPLLEPVELSETQGLISFAFIAMKKGVNIQLRDIIQDEERADMLENIIKLLIKLDTESLHFVYVISPFLEAEGIEVLNRLKLEFIINLGPNVFGSSTFKQMLWRSSPVGFRPVVKVLYSMYWDIESKRKLFIKRGFPADIVRMMNEFVMSSTIAKSGRRTSELTFIDAMKRLGRAVEKHLLQEGH
jgi:hypothetical protein